MSNQREKELLEELELIRQAILKALEPKDSLLFVDLSYLVGRASDIKDCLRIEQMRE